MKRFFNESFDRCFQFTPINGQWAHPCLRSCSSCFCPCSRVLSSLTFVVHIRVHVGADRPEVNASMGIIMKTTKYTEVLYSAIGDGMLTLDSRRAMFDECWTPDVF